VVVPRGVTHLLTLRQQAIRGGFRESLPEDHSMHSPRTFLEVELRGKLANTRVSRTRDLTKIRGRHDSARCQELRVVENVVELSAQLQVQALGELRILDEGEIPVVDSRAMEEPTIGIPLCANRGGGKGVGIKVEISR